MTTWITDENGNRASVEYWGSGEAARAALATLVNCWNCWNCWNCTDCRNCDLTKPHYRLPVSEPRSYTWLAIEEGRQWVIRAGCRCKTIEEARTHWGSDGYCGPQTVKETVPLALDWLEGKIR